MSQQLENFIRKNRAGFDELEPPAGLWSRIEERIDGHQQLKPFGARVIRVSLLLKVAAMLAVVLTAGTLFIHYNRQQPVDISMINPELGKMEVQYASMIESRQQEIKQVEKDDPYLYGEFSSEIKKMDTSYQKLKNELSTSPNQEETVKAMIRNLQTQLGVLNQQLTIIQQINQAKKPQSNGKQII